MADGQVVIDVDVNDKDVTGLNKQLNQLEGSSSKAGFSIKNLALTMGLVKVASAAIGTACSAIKTAFSTAISEGANLEQSLGGIETLFKGSADKVKKYADEAYKTSGLSANAYMENVTSFSASLLQSVGGDTEKAADVANMAMIDMSDNANKMGTNIRDIQNAYQGFAKQNYTMLDNLKLGYGGTKEEMQRLLSDAEKLTGVKYDMNNLSDVYNAIHAIQGKLDITGTTAKEAASTFSGSFAAMKASLSNVLGKMALGQDIKPSLNALAETISTFLFGNFIPMVGNILKALPGAIVTFIKAAIPYVKEEIGNLLGSALEPFQDIRKKITGSFKGFDELGDTFSNLKSKVDLPTTGLKILQLAFSALLVPAGLVLKVVGMIADAFQNKGIKGGMSQISQSFEELASSMEQNAPKLGTTFGTALEGILTAIAAALPGIVAGGLKVIAGFVAGLAQGLPQLTLAAVQLITAFTEAMLLLIPTITMSATTIIVAFIRALTASSLQIVSAGAALINALLQGITLQIPSLVANTAVLIVTWLTALNSHLPKILQAGMNLLLTYIQGIANNIGKITDQAISVVLNFINAISNRMGDIIDTAVNLMINFLNGLSSRMPDIVDAGVTLIVSVLEGIENNLTRIIDAGTDLVVKCIEGIGNNLYRLTGAAADLVDKLVDNIINFSDRMWKAAIRLVNGLADGIDNNKEEAREAVRRLVDSLGSAIFGDELWDAGSALMGGLLKGIKWGFEKVKGFVSGIADTIASLKGPLPYDKKVLIDNGSALMFGLKRGLIDGFENVKDLTSNMADELSKSFTFESSFSKFNFSSPELALNTNMMGATSLGSRIINNSSNTVKTINNQPLITMSVKWEGKEDIRRTMEEIGWITKIEDQGGLI